MFHGYFDRGDILAPGTHLIREYLYTPITCPIMFPISEISKAYEIKKRKSNKDMNDGITVSVDLLLHLYSLYTSLNYDYSGNYHLCNLEKFYII